MRNMGVDKFSYVCLAFWSNAVLAKPDFAIVGPALDFYEDYQRSAYFGFEKNKEIIDQPQSTTNLPDNSNRMDCARICLREKGCVAVNYRQGICETFNESIAQITTVMKEGLFIMTFTQLPSPKCKFVLLEKCTQLAFSFHMQ